MNVIALLSCLIAAGTLTALIVTRERLSTARKEATRLQESLQRKRPAAISLPQVQSSTRMEAVQQAAIELVKEIAPQAEIGSPEEGLSFLKQVFQDQRRANEEFSAHLKAVREELISTKRRMEESRSALQQIRIRRGTAEIQLEKLEETLADVMAERDQLRWQLRQAEEEPAELKKSA